MTTEKTSETCNRCGGFLPEIGSEAWQASNGECPGSVATVEPWDSLTLCCGAFDPRLSWEVEVKKCECSGCGCTEPATTTDDVGIPVCDECVEYMVDEGGEVICARETDSFSTCHVCHENIVWGGILTHDSGSGRPNFRLGSCDCGGEAWLDENRGGWGHYSYCVLED